MSISVLPQLLEVDSELSAQAAVLEAKLNELQTKRNGIQTVISMFESGETPAVDIPTVAQTATKTATKTAPKKTAAKTAPKTAPKIATATKASGKQADRKQTASKHKAAKSTKSKTTRVTKTKAEAPAKTAISKKTKKTTKAAAGSKRSGRTADWQRYVQGTYRKSPLPDVIVGVLQAQPDNVFKIVDVMNVVFKENMPKDHFLKARNRISNILSAGARDGVWHRGRGGTYSMSEKAIKAS